MQHDMAPEGEDHSLYDCNETCLDSLAYDLDGGALVYSDVTHRCPLARKYASDAEANARIRSADSRALAESKPSANKNGPAGAFGEQAKHERYPPEGGCHCTPLRWSHSVPWAKWPNNYS